MDRGLLRHVSICLRGAANAVAVLALASLFAMLPPPPASADEQATRATLTGEHESQQFLAGERVEITEARVTDDVFAAGEDVIFEKVTAETIIAAAKTLILEGVSADDMILAGGEMDLSGEIADDVVAAVCPVCLFGGRLHVARATEIGDDARLAGRDVIIDGRIGGDLHAAGKYFRLTGEIAGDARIHAERIVLRPGARIGGDLLYGAPTEPEVPEGALVEGEIRQLASEAPFAMERPEPSLWSGVLAVLGFLLALILLGAALQLAVPGLLSRAAATAAGSPWASLGRGLVVALLTPAVAALLMATVVGIPIGLVAMAAFCVLLALACVAIAYCIGLYLRRLFGHQDEPAGLGAKALWTAVGIFTLAVVGLIPFIGWAVGMLAVIAGLGAAVIGLGPPLRRTRT